jgi:hypothetical protein
MCIAEFSWGITRSGRDQRQRKSTLAHRLREKRGQWASVPGRGTQLASAWWDHRRGCWVVPMLLLGAAVGDISEKLARVLPVGAIVN